MSGGCPHFLVRPQGNQCINPCSQQPVLHSRYIDEKDQMGYNGYIERLDRRKWDGMAWDEMAWDGIGKMDECGWINGGMNAWTERMDIETEA